MSERLTAKVKQGVRPYGGKALRYVEEHIWPNGRHTVDLLAPGVSPWGSSTRTYSIDEIGRLPESRRIIRLSA